MSFPFEFVVTEGCTYHAAQKCKLTHMVWNYIRPCFGMNISLRLVLFDKQCSPERYVFFVSLIYSLIMTLLDAVAKEDIKIFSFSCIVRFIH